MFRGRQNLTVSISLLREERSLDSTEVRAKQVHVFLLGYESNNIIHLEPAPLEVLDSNP
jgi:hypothetical protein